MDDSEGPFIVWHRKVRRIMFRDHKGGPPTLYATQADAWAEIERRGQGITEGECPWELYPYLRWAIEYGR